VFDLASVPLTPHWVSRATHNAPLTPVFPHAFPKGLSSTQPRSLLGRSPCSVQNGAYCVAWFFTPAL